MKTVKVDLSEATEDLSYDIHVGRNLFPQIAEDIANSTNAKRKIALITDYNLVISGQVKLLTQELNKAGLKVDNFTFPPGEPHKTEATSMSVTDRMFEKGYNRDSLVIALGGGVVGDLAGFVASKIVRGVPLIQIPTTVLSQADSSVGGKVGVDHPIGGKNSIGAFKQPDVVYIDVETLKTLPDEEYIAGFAEHVKHGVIRDLDYLEFLENNIGAIRNRDLDFLVEASARSCAIKAEVVQIDPKEKGLRQILNYGHTAGHAIEHLSLERYERGVSPNFLRHGEAVAIGMMVAGRISNYINLFSSDEILRQRNLLEAIGLPTIIPEEIEAEDIIAITSKDKKALEGKARYVLPRKIGEMQIFGKRTLSENHSLPIYSTPIDSSMVEDAIKETR